MGDLPAGTKGQCFGESGEANVWQQENVALARSTWRSFKNYVGISTFYFKCSDVLSVMFLVVLYEQ